MSNYISFHNHDCLGSLLDSTLKLDDLIKWAKANNMKAVGTQNHGNLSSCIQLYKKCVKEGIKPLLGFEAYVTENKLDEEGKKIRDNYHIGLLAKNFNGWKNLVKLHNLAWKDNRYYYDPRITLEDLFKYKEDIIVNSACIGGILGKRWLVNDLEGAENVLIKLVENFGDDFYLEIQAHESDNEEEKEQQFNYNKWIIKMSKKYNVKIICQQDAHYYLKEDWEAHQVLLCKNTGSKLSNPKFTFGSHDYYLKNEVEMLDAFTNYPLTLMEECFKNTSDIADKIEEFDITNKVYDCPSFGEPEEAYNKLVMASKNGIKNRFTDEFLKEHPEYNERLNYELSIVKQVGYVDYFLMLDDLYRYTEKNNIYMGIGRGSACGSLVLYCLGVTHVDPIRYNLLFERFINVDRVSACDVDCDVNDKDRPKVVQYIKNRYGEDHVCNIGTYGELTAKSSFKTVASVLEIPFDKANGLTSIMDSELSLEDNYKQIDTFRLACENDELINRAYKIALKLEGTFANRGLHACGLVISSKPLDDVCSCVTVKDPKGTERIVSTSNEMKEVDGDLKLLKLDVLGLRNLGILEEATRYIKERHGVTLDYKNLDVEDKKTYQMLSNGYTYGVFQFESPLMQKLMRDIQPRCIEDLSCITSTARPGCLESGLTDQYIQRRQGKEEVTPFVEGTEEYMKDSLQLPIYQENIMQISRVMAGFTGSEADTLRKYVGKKDPIKLKAEREHFVTGAVNNGFTNERANEVFDDIEKFGRYGFNKSHAVGYSLLSYATAYYKANYPIEYMCALLNSVTDDLDKLNMYISECYRLGIVLTPPDINISGEQFSINDKNEIVFAISSIKGLGKTVVRDILRTRKESLFTSFVDFVKRTTKVDKSALQALLRVGAFNNIEKNCKRWDLLSEYINDAKNSKYNLEEEKLEDVIYKIVGLKNGRKSEKYLELAEFKRNLGSSKADKTKKDEFTKQQEYVLDAYCKHTAIHFSQYTDFSIKERIENEQELIGFNISTNPYKRWNDFKKYYIQNNEGNIEYVDLNELVDNSHNYADLPKFHTVGLLSDIKSFKTKRGDKMARLTVEYYGAKTNITVFAQQWENNMEFKLQKGNFVSIHGRLVESNKQYNSNDYEIRLESIRQLNVLVNKNNKCIINVNNNNIDKIINSVKMFSGIERKEFIPIERIVLLKYPNDKYKVLNGLVWVGNADKLLKEIL